MLDTFGSRQFNEAFWIISLIPGPVWVMLILIPDNIITRRLVSPFVLPALLGVVYLYFVYLLFTYGPPSTPDGVSMKEVRRFVIHPLVFLVLWSHLMITNLFVGMRMYEDARSRHCHVPVELFICWFFAPIALMIYGIRRSLTISSKSKDGKS
jgi:hypothetical protein